MSESSKKGKGLELEIAKMLRSKLGVKVARDKRSGAGSVNKADMNDWYREVPLFIEAKNHKTVNIKEWFRQARGHASVGQAPTVVFQMENEILACLRFEDLINFLTELRDNKVEIDSLRAPELHSDDIYKLGEEKPVARVSYKTCRAGHMSDEYGYCMILSCKYTRNYRPSKK